MVQLQPHEVQLALTQGSAGVSAGTATAVNAAGNSVTVLKEVTAEQGAASRDRRVNAGIPSTVNSVGNRNTAGQKVRIPIQ